VRGPLQRAAPSFLPSPASILPLTVLSDYPALCLVARIRAGFARLCSRPRLLVLMPVLGPINVLLLESRHLGLLVVALALGSTSSWAWRGCSTSLVASRRLTPTLRSSASPHAQCALRAVGLSPAPFGSIRCPGIGLTVRPGRRAARAPVLRLRGDYLARDPGFWLVVRVLANHPRQSHSTSRTGNSRRLTPLSRPPLPFEVSYAVGFYFLVLLNASWWSSSSTTAWRTRTRRALEAMLEDDLAAQGYCRSRSCSPISIAFAAGSLRRLMGVVFSAQAGLINPESSLPRSIGVLALVILAAWAVLRAGDHRRHRCDGGSSAGAQVAVALANSSQNAGVTILATTWRACPRSSSPPVEG